MSANKPVLPILFGDSDINALNEAWQQKSTFAYAAKRSGVSENWIKAQLELLPNEFHEDRFVLFTSGSTGEPKLIIGNKKRSEHLAQVLHNAQDSEPVKETVVILPLTYTFAFVNQWLWAKTHVRKLTLTEGLSDPNKLADTLKRSEKSMVCMVGAQIPLFRQYFQDQCFEHVIRLHFAGGPFPQNELGFIRQLFPNASVYNNYGCAEAMPRLTIRKAQSAQEAQNVGMPLPGVKIRISDEGDVEFLSPYRAEGQIANEEFEIFTDDYWIASGDKGELTPDGQLCLHGRANQVFKRYGEKISLPQLVRTVKETWDGQAVFYTEEDAKGEPGHVLLLSPTPEKALITAILRGFRAKYPRTHWPLRIESTPSIPLLNNGKEDLQAAAALENTTTHWAQRI